ncbi:hypothetical protein ACJROX_05155 [Pseudalkalibacillus sp. A8]|uniref:hypothetical protein n=1 Tax=Pseudalkalibacillus sp. A8 TaxID=3382641 RepID=UPI0038B5173D
MNQKVFAFTGDMMNDKLKATLIAITGVFAILFITCPTAEDYTQWLADNSILTCDFKKCTTFSSKTNSAGFVRTNIDQVKESGSFIHTGWLFFMTAETYIEKDRTIKVVGLLNFIIPYENKLDNGGIYPLHFLD